MTTTPNRDLLDGARALADTLTRRGQEADAALVDRLAVALEREWRLRAARAPRPPLTRVQREILSFIEAHHGAHSTAPTLGEIGRKIGRAPSTVHEHIAALQEKGYVCRDHNRGRAITLIEAGAA